MWRKKYTPSLHCGRVDDALRKIEANLESAGSAGDHRQLLEAVDRVLSSHPCHDVAHVYGLLLKGLTWTEVSDCLYANEVSQR